MPSVIRRYDEQAADLLDWEAGQDSEQAATVDDGERFISQVFRNEFIRLRRMSDQALGEPGDRPDTLKRAAQARKTIKLIGLLALVEVMKWPLETVCVMIDPFDFAPMGNATAERWLDAARSYLALRLPKISDDVYDLVKPSRTIKKSRRSAALVTDSELAQLDAAARRQAHEWSDEFLADYYTATGEGPVRSRSKRVVSGSSVVSRQKSLFAGGE